MDVLHFLKLRTEFIRGHYETASAPFREIVRKIEAEEAPYIPDYYDVGPTFELEWNDAQVSLQILGLCCVSMLSDSLKLYFQTWKDQLRPEATTASQVAFSSDGFLAGYQVLFDKQLKVKWSDGPADLGIIEQVILARNRGAHGGDIASLSITHSQKDIDKHPNPLFVHESEKNFESTIWTPRLEVSQDSLFNAIKQVETLAEWLEEKMFAAKYKRI